MASIDAITPEMLQKWHKERYVPQNAILGVAGDITADALMKLRPVTFFYKPEYEDGPRTLQYGLIAEEVAEVYPDLVVKNKDGEIETVQYHKLIPMLMNELQKDHETIQLLKEQVAALQHSR